MKYLIIYSLIFLFVHNKIAAQSVFKKTEVIKGITLSLPSDFIPMSDQEYGNKYGGYRKPIAMYTNGQADFGVNVALTQVPPDAQYAKKGAPWKREDIEMMRQLYKSTILRIHSKVDFIQDEVREINEQNFAVFEFVAEVKDEQNSAIVSGQKIEQYSYIQYTVENDKILIFNFTCPSSLKGVYQPIAKQILNSIVISNL